MKLKTVLIFFISLVLLGCGKAGVDSLRGASNDKTKLKDPDYILIENHEQIVTLEYDEAFTATSCSLSNLIGLDVTTSCSCAAGICTVGLTPTGTGGGSYTFSVSDGSSSSENEVVITQTKEVIPFVSTWRVGDAGYGDGDLTVTLPLRSGFNYNFTVDWGDGKTDEVTAHNDSDIDHLYDSGGDYTITISGLVEAWYFNNAGDKDKIISIQELGRVGWKSFENAFSHCYNLGQVVGGDTSEVISMEGMFKSLYLLGTYFNTTL
ncbi:MAG: hypothetical protein CME64_05245 [Halobacteriovoraceae bacterium]|nr:hypothetical protein [Halobacteriovoraceae bacterium]|tara:strand:+ start:293012 stop:293803 length:792 start_codon:yes stop_codon:yes gene_type:complete